MKNLKKENLKKIETKEKLVEGGEPPLYLPRKIGE